MNENTLSQINWGIEFNDWNNNVEEEVFDSFREKHPNWFWTDRIKNKIVKTNDVHKKVNVLKPVLTDAVAFTNHINKSPKKIDFINYLFYFDDINYEWYDIFRTKLTSVEQKKMNVQYGDFRYVLMSSEKANNSLIKDVYSYMSWVLYRYQHCQDGPLFREFYDAIGCNIFTEVKFLKHFSNIQYNLLNCYSEERAILLYYVHMLRTEELRRKYNLNEQWKR